MRSFRFLLAFGLIALAPLTSGCDKRAAKQSSTSASGSRSSSTTTHAVTSSSGASAKASAKPSAPTPATLPPMNVMIIVVDALRDDMPWHGYKRNIAPNLTKLYNKSVRYERGYSISSYTSKSVGGLLSGQYPESLARTTPFFTKYEDSNLMLAEVLQKHGVRTIGAQAHMYLKEQSGLQQGFDVWQVVPGIQWDYNKDPYVTSDKHAKLIIDQLSKPENTKGPFFTYYHFMDPHHEYKAHPEAPQWGHHARDHYDEEVWYTDFYIQKVLDYVWSQPWGQRTAIIVTADHGEAFGEHNFYKHAFELYEVLIKVPLFVYIPGVKPRTIHRWRSGIDIAPTVLDLMHVKKPADMRLQGTSLLPELLGKDTPQRPILANIPADSYNVRHRALIDKDGYKIVQIGHHAKYDLFNVKTDPGEKTKLGAKQPERKKKMIERLTQMWSKIPVVEAKGGGKPVMKD